MTILCDGYSESNYSSSYALNADNWRGLTFTGNGSKIDTAKFYLKKMTVPSGTIVAKIYNHTGTFGTNGKPTGSAIAASDSFNATTISDSIFELITFTFTSTNKIFLSKGNKYCIVLEPSFGGTYMVLIGVDNTSPTHSGNRINSYDLGVNWSTSSTEDVCFYIYTDDQKTSPFPVFRRS